jgi:hypothetical protein
MADPGSRALALEAAPDLTDDPPAAPGAGRLPRLGRSIRQSAAPLGIANSPSSA